MNNPNLPLLTTRREFLHNGVRGIGLLSFSQFAPAFLTQSVLARVPEPEKDRTILVMIQLAGGNDGLNTLVPYEDARYYRLRPKIALKKNDVIPIADNLAFHPSCEALANLFKDGKLSIVQNVGYPNPNRSHFRSSEIWETAGDSDEYLATGWLGRFFDNSCCGQADPESPIGIHIGNQTPQSFMASRAHNLFGVPRRGRGRKPRERELLNQLASTPVEGENTEFLRHTLMDTLVTEKRIYQLTNRYRPLVEYPSSRLGVSLRGVAAMIASGLETRVYFVSQSGYDTHANQQSTHARLLTELSESMAAFQHDLEAHRLQDQVLTMTFSEFGRRPAENNGGGTDHGTAAPLFVAGSSLKSSIIGSGPDLNVGRKEDLKYSIDFRQVYSTVIDKWFDCRSEDILGSKFDNLPFV